MEAGREMDALVAKKNKWVCRYVVSASKDPALMERCAGGSDCEEHLPFFSSDISDAWEVAEWVEKISGFVLFKSSAITHDGRVWIVAQSYQEADDTRLGEAPTVAHAICLAALKAVGG